MKKTLKGLCAFAFAFVLLLGLTGCGEEKTNNGGGNNNGGNIKPVECTATKSTDSFVDKYDYAESYMLPKGGVYTGYKDQKIMADIGYFYFTVSCITEAELEEYKNVLEENGYVYENATYKNKTEDKKIIISNYISSNNFIYVYVYPSIDM